MCVLGEGEKGFETTYEDLKPATEQPSMFVKQGFETTYEDLKHW